MSLILAILAFLCVILSLYGYFFKSDWITKQSYQFLKILFFIEGIHQLWLGVEKIIKMSNNYNIFLAMLNIFIGVLIIFLIVSSLKKDNKLSE